MDALCQGIESWWSVNSTVESMVYSKKAIELIMANWRKYIFENDDNAAANIMLAANYGGRAINIAQTTAAHAMSYKITSMFKLPHGHAVAVCLPEIWDYMIQHSSDLIDLRGQDYLNRIFAEIAFTMGCGKVEIAISVFRQMLQDMNLKYPSSHNKEHDIIVLAQSVNPERLKNNPVELNTVVIEKLYSDILK